MVTTGMADLAGQLLHSMWGMVLGSGHSPEHQQEVGTLPCTSIQVLIEKEGFLDPLNFSLRLE